jgi:hypothetical protein
MKESWCLLPRSRLSVFHPVSLFWPSVLSDLVLTWKFLAKNGILNEESKRESDEHFVLIGTQMLNILIEQI